MSRRLLMGLLLAGACGPALADPISIVAFLAPIIGGTAAAFIVSYAGTIALTALGVYGSARARSKQRKAQAQARAAYNASLQDRNVSVLAADPPRRYRLGRCWGGGEVVAVFTTNKQGLNENGSSYTKADGYKHVVIVWAYHQCAAIHDLAFEGVSIGPLDVDGWSLSAHWSNTRRQNQSRSVLGGISTALLGSLNAVTAVTLVIDYADPKTARHVPVPSGGSYGWSLSGSTINLPAQVLFNDAPYTPTAADRWEVNYAREAPDRSTVRVRHHLGEPGQAADALLMSLVPASWTAAHKGTGLCYSVITMDLERQEFQSGPGGWTADISGLIVRDPRTGADAWTSNPALLAYWYLQQSIGFSRAAADIDEASVIAAANACDEIVSYRVWNGTEFVLTPSPRYTCHGAITSDQDRESVLQDIAESMGGWVYPSGQWVVQAGAWTPPVMDLTDDDLYGSISIVQSGEPMGELFNSVRGRYVASNTAVATEMTPYTNPVFVAGDGGRLWDTVDLPFTNSDHRATQIARVKTEQARNGETIFYPAKMRAWPLQPGDRVRVKSAEYGFDYKWFRVTDWSFGLTAPVGLTLQADTPEGYDLADAELLDPTPNTVLPSPSIVPPITGLAVTSGTAELLQQADGTITSRVKVSWDRTYAAYMAEGRIEISWRAVGRDVWTRVDAAGDDTSVYITGPQDGTVIIVSVVVVNGLRFRSPETWAWHLVLGKTEPPALASGLVLSVVPGALRGTLTTPSTELDYARTVYRYGLSFAAGLPVPGTSDKGGFNWPGPPVGPVTIWYAHQDTSGNIGPAASASITVTAAALFPPSNTLSIKLNVNDFAGTLNYNEAYIHGYSNGAPADVPGTVLINGVQTLAPNQWVLTNIGPGQFYLMFDTAGLFDFGGFGLRHYAMVRRSGGVWQYDNNTGAWQTFTPSGTMVVIGSVSPAVADANVAPGLTSGSIWATAWSPDAIAAVADSANWSGVGGRPSMYRVAARGYSATGYPIESGLYDADTGGLLVGPANMYRVAKIHRSTKLVTDVGGWNTLASTANADAMAAALNAIGNDHIVVVFSFDEPQGNRLHPPLLAAMLRHGASMPVYGSPQFRFRSAYVLVAIGACGPGKGAECYGGEVDSDPNAWCDVGFSLHNGVLQVSGASSGARSLYDYGYVQSDNIAIGALVSSYSARTAGPIGWSNIT